VIEPLSFFSLTLVSSITGYFIALLYILSKWLGIMAPRCTASHPKQTNTYLFSSVVSDSYWITHL